MPEIWKAIPGFEGMYEVSDQGRVRSVDRVVLSGRGAIRRKGQLLSSHSVNRYGHQIVKLGTYRRALVHVLVAEAFIGPKRESQEVRHLNGDPIDNRASNLVYGTRRENQRDHYTYGGKHAGGKLSRDDVLAIRALLSEGVAQKEIAAAYGVSLSQISAIKTRRSFDYI